MNNRPMLSRRGALMRRLAEEWAGSGRLEMRLFRLGGETGASRHRPVERREAQAPTSRAAGPMARP